MLCRFIVCRAVRLDRTRGGCFGPEDGFMVVPGVDEWCGLDVSILGSAPAVITYGDGRVDLFRALVPDEEKMA